MLVWLKDYIVTIITIIIRFKYHNVYKYDHLIMTKYVYHIFISQQYYNNGTIYCDTHTPSWALTFAPCCKARFTSPNIPILADVISKSS